MQFCALGRMAASPGPASFGAALMLNFSGSQLDPRITFTRASAGWHTNSAGLIVQAGINAPRIDHDPETRQLRGLLIEEQRTNVLAVQPLGWSGNAITIAASTADSPDGTKNATLCTNQAGAGGIYFYTGTTANQPHTYSIYLKKQVGDWVFVQAEGGGNFAGCYVNLATLTKGGQSVTTDTGVTTRVQKCQNGWCRVEITATSAVASRSIQVFACTADGDLNRVAGNAFHAWGAQIERGAFPTSVIMTAGSAVTRAPDDATIPTAGWYKQGGGIFSARCSVVRAADNVYPKVFTVDDGTEPNRIFIFTSGTSNGYGSGLRADIAGVNQANFGAPGLSAYGDQLSVVASFGDLNSRIIASNPGGDVDSFISTGSIPTGLAVMRIGGNFYGAEGAICIRSIKYESNQSKSFNSMKASLSTA